MSATKFNAAQLVALREFVTARIVFCPPSTDSRRRAFSALYRRGVLEAAAGSHRRDVRDVARFQLTAEGVIRARRAGVFVLI